MADLFPIVDQVSEQKLGPSFAWHRLLRKISGLTLFQSILAELKASAGLFRLTGDLQAAVAAPYVAPLTYIVVLGSAPGDGVISTCTVRNKYETSEDADFPAGLTVAFGTIDGAGVFTAKTAATDLAGETAVSSIAPTVPAAAYTEATVFAAQVTIPVGETAAIGLDLDFAAS